MKKRSSLAIGLACLAGLATPIGLDAAGASQKAARKAAAPLPVLRVIAVKGYGHVVADAAGHSLYLLSAEAGSKIVCKGACLSIWPPLLVPASTKALRVAPGVKGHIGYVARSRTEKQVTLNGYPLYTFVGDKKPAETSGEGITHFGGTWFLIRPSATTPAATRITPLAAKTHTPKPTTSTAGSSYSGYARTTAASSPKGSW
jgi:predicted lipoprotein with Yx(FWY)xxD motif